MQKFAYKYNDNYTMKKIRSWYACGGLKSTDFISFGAFDLWSMLQNIDADKKRELAGNSFRTGYFSSFCQNWWKQIERAEPQTEET